MFISLAHFLSARFLPIHRFPLRIVSVQRVSFLLCIVCLLELALCDSFRLIVKKCNLFVGYGYVHILQGGNLFIPHFVNKLRIWRASV